MRCNANIVCVADNGYGYGYGYGALINAFWVRDSDFRLRAYGSGYSCTYELAYVRL
jgi:hypothetical protein